MHSSEHRVVGGVPRRGLIALCAAGAASGLSGPPARALAPQDANVMKAVAWLLGTNLALAGLLYNQNVSGALLDDTLGKARKMAEIAGVTVPPFPRKQSTSAASSADLVHYLIAGDGAKLGSALAGKYGEEHSILFEVGVKSTLLILLYGPGDKNGMAIAEVVTNRLDKIKLPRHLWTGLVTLVKNRRSQDEVKSAVFKLHKDVANYFVPDLIK